MGRNITLTDQGTLVFKEGTGGGTDGVTIQAPATLAAAYTLTLPVDDGDANEFLQTNGSGVLAWATSASTLQSAYDGGGKITTAGAVPVEIEIGAASGNVGLLIDQDDDFIGLQITKDGVGAGAGINIANAGTGQGILVTQSGAGIGLQVTQNAAAAAIQLNQTQDSQGIDLNKTGAGAGIALDITNNGTSDAVVIDQNGAARALRIDQATSADGVELNQTSGTAIDLNYTGVSAGKALDIRYDGTTDGILVDATGGTGRGMTINNASTTNPALICERFVNMSSDTNYVTKFIKGGTGAGSCLLLENDGTGEGLHVDMTRGSGGSGTGILVETTLSSTARGLFLDINGNGKALQIDSEASTSNVVEIDDASTGDSIFINKTGNGPCLDIDSTSATNVINVSHTGDTNITCVLANSGTGAAVPSVLRVNHSNTTAATDAVIHIDQIAATATTCLQIDSAGSANYIDTDAGAGTPAHLTNGGVWTDASCFRKFKRDIEPVDTNLVLDGIRQMSISRYFDKADRSEKPRRRFAPFQDDLVELFELDDRGVSPLEVAAIALAGVKALAEKLHGKENGTSSNQ